MEHLATQCLWSEMPAVIGDVLPVHCGDERRAIVFCETKKNVTGMTMNPHGTDFPEFPPGYCTVKRKITLKGFGEGSFKVRVANKMALHGLDVPEVDLVIPGSPPQDGRSYIHPSGGTDTADQTGICIFLSTKRKKSTKICGTKNRNYFTRTGVLSKM